MKPAKGTRKARRLPWWWMRVHSGCKIGAMVLISTLDAVLNGRRKLEEQQGKESRNWKAEEREVYSNLEVAYTYIPHHIHHTALNAAYRSSRSKLLTHTFPALTTASLPFDKHLLACMHTIGFPEIPGVQHPSQPANRLRCIQPCIPPHVLMRIRFLHQYPLPHKMVTGNTFEREQQSCMLTLPKIGSRNDQRWLISRYRCLVRLHCVLSRERVVGIVVVESGWVRGAHAYGRL